MQEWETLNEDTELPSKIWDDLTRMGPVQLRLSARIGQADVAIQDWLQLGVGSQIVLKSEWRSPIDLKLNGKTVGTGQVVLVGNRFGVMVKTWGPQSADSGPRE